MLYNSNVRIKRYSYYLYQYAQPIVTVFVGMGITFILNRKGEAA